MKHYTVAVLTLRRCLLVEGPGEETAERDRMEGLGNCHGSGAEGTVFDGKAWKTGPTLYRMRCVSWRQRVEYVHRLTCGREEGGRDADIDALSLLAMPVNCRWEGGRTSPYSEMVDAREVCEFMLRKFRG